MSCPPHCCAFFLIFLKKKLHYVSIFHFFSEILLFRIFTVFRLESMQSLIALARFAVIPVRKRRMNMLKSLLKSVFFERNEA